MGPAIANSFYVQSEDPHEYLLRRIQRYVDIALTHPRQRVFLVGWIARVIALWRVVSK
jgi:hypothetical protein